MNRSATISRQTNETTVSVSLNLDGTGHCDIQTSVPFLDHMLTLMAVHGHLDLKIRATGDLVVDAHHTVEDVGIVVGQAFKQSIAESVGIERYASVRIPMDEALCDMAMDISGRPRLIYNFKIPAPKVGDFDTELVQEFLEAFVTHAKITLHVDGVRGVNSHHCIEAIFKAIGRCVKVAVCYNNRQIGVPSSKGVL